MNKSHGLDVAIAGGGIVGLSLALELRERGLSVLVLERNQAMSSASWAAGGMLAVNDPQNPPGLFPLSVRSWELYPAYLERIEELSGRSVPLRTHRTLQEPKPKREGSPVTAAELAELAPGLEVGTHNFEWLEEGSLDPNDLREALPVAFRAAGGSLLEQTDVLSVAAATNGVLVHTRTEKIAAGMFVNCCGAWAAGPPLGGVPVSPVKGHMLNLRCKPELLRCVVRTPAVYLVPRGDGRVTTGATVEKAGFDESVHEPRLQPLTEAALRLLPQASLPPEMDAWAGLRPGTPDGLPILGPAKEPHCWHATGHYRDGILLAPVTARVMAQVLLRETPDVELHAYRPERFDSAA